MPEELANGCVVLEKEKRLLHRRSGGKWVKTEEETIELINGE